MTTTSTTGTSLRLTAEDFMVGDFPRGAQLIEGKVIVTDPRMWHQELCKRLLVALETWTRSRPDRGLVGFGGNWRLDEHSLYKPDVWWTDVGHVPAMTTLRHDGPPDLAVEVRAPGTWVFDVGPKKSTYERQGLPELWLVDGFGLAVLVFRRSVPGSKTFDVEHELGVEDALTSPRLPDFRLDVAELFAGAP